MRARTSDREVCHKSGVILTCYVDGRKRFRAVPLGCDAQDEDSGDECSRQGNRLTAEQIALMARRFRRPN
jgi:hypothetical protein